MAKAILFIKIQANKPLVFFDRKQNKKGRVVFNRSFLPNLDRQALQAHILSASLEELFSLKEPSFTLPEHARIFTSVVCEQCGESAPEHKMRLEEGKKVCLDCAKSYSRGF